ncbi:MAG: YlxR family protein, partial [Prochlorococcaceae cyanobacterium]
FDPTGKANGRGVYLSKDKTVIEKAKISGFPFSGGTQRQKKNDCNYQVFHTCFIICFLKHDANPCIEYF